MDVVFESLFPILLVPLISLGLLAVRYLACSIIADLRGLFLEGSTSEGNEDEENTDEHNRLKSSIKIIKTKTSLLEKKVNIVKLTKQLLESESKLKRQQDKEIREGESDKCKQLEEDLKKLIDDFEQERIANKQPPDSGVDHHRRLIDSLKEKREQSYRDQKQREVSRFEERCRMLELQQEHLQKRVSIFQGRCKKLEGERKELMRVLELERAENKSFTREIGRLSNLVQTSLKEGKTLKQLCLDHEQEDVLRLEERCRMLEVEKSAQLTMVEERCKRLEEELVKKMQDLDDHTQDERKFTSEKLLTSLNSAHTNITETCQGVLDKQDTLLKVFMEASKHRNEAGSSTAEWEMLDYSVEQDIEEC